MEKWNPILTERELDRRYKIFMNRYQDKFPLKVKNEMDNYFVRRSGKYDNPMDFFQLYDHLGNLPDEINFYLYHVNNIKENFNIYNNILEIGGGIYPSFARRLANEQLKLGIGTVSVYDPRLVTKRCTKYPNLKLYKREFNKGVDISKYSLLIGIMPCDATDLMIDTINKYNKDFYIAFCGCGKYSINSLYYRWFLPDYERQIDTLQNICEKNRLGELVIEHLPDRYNVEYPIVYNKRKI